MTLAQVVKETGIQTRTFKPALNIFGKETGWIRNWDNDLRISVSMHIETWKIVGENVGFDKLELTKVERESTVGKYTSYTIERSL
jgi:hypothetical protein